MSIHISGVSLGGGLGPLLDRRSRRCARSPCNCTASLNKVTVRSHLLWIHACLVKFVCPLQAQTLMRHSVYIIPSCAGHHGYNVSSCPWGGGTVWEILRIHTLYPHNTEYIAVPLGGRGGGVALASCTGFSGIEAALSKGTNTLQLM